MFQRRLRSNHSSRKIYRRLVLVMSVIVVIDPAQAVDIELPPGFQISLYTDEVLNARQMALGDNGTVFVGTRNKGRIYAIVDTDRDYRVDRVVLIAKGLTLPSGVAFRDGSLYVAALDRILRFDDIESRLQESLSPVVVTDDLPSATHHGLRFIDFGPDGLLYISVGAPCNICQKTDERFGSILRLNLETGVTEVFAKGVRNSVGFDWHPETNTLWFTDNGRDWLGDDLPPDELNVANKSGQHFGFPFVYGNNQPDPKFRHQNQRTFIGPALALQAHSAPLGVLFYTGEMFPPQYRKSLFIAQHGSWNRSRKVGYQVLNVRIRGEQVVATEVFAQGWLKYQTVTGRPVAFLQMPDGSILMSDDRIGAIYRISYKK